MEITSKHRRVMNQPLSIKIEGVVKFSASNAGQCFHFLFVELCATASNCKENLSFKKPFVVSSTYTLQVMLGFILICKVVTYCHDE